MTRTALDPITAAVIQSSLIAAADEMFAVLKNTAMSPIIYEVLDVGTGILDARGELVSSGAGIPTFVGVLDKAVRRLIELHAPETIRPGAPRSSTDRTAGDEADVSSKVAVAVAASAEVLVTRRK